MSRLFWAACRPSRRFPSRFLRPSHAGGVPMDASRLVAAFALAQGQGCGKSGGRPVAAGLGAGLLKHTHPLMPPPLRSVGLGDTSTDHIHLLARQIALEIDAPASSRQQDTEVPQKMPRSCTSASMACATASLKSPRWLVSAAGWAPGVVVRFFVRIWARQVGGNGHQGGNSVTEGPDLHVAWFCGHPRSSPSQTRP